MPENVESFPNGDNFGSNSRDRRGRISVSLVRRAGRKLVSNKIPEKMTTRSLMGEGVC